MPYTKTKDNRLVNEVTLGDGYPLSNDLQPLKIGGEASILGISSPLPDGSDSGLFRVDGDLDITGTLKTKLSHDLIYDFDDEVNTLAQAKVDALIDSAPAALDTLNELAAALGDDASFATTVTNSIATKVSLTGDETVAGHKKFSDDVLIAGTAADTGTNDEVSLGVNGNSLRVYTNYGYVNVGPQNTSWSHFYTDRARYYFNKEITVDTGLISSYNEDLILRRDYDDTSYNQITIGDDSFELKLDNTARLSVDGDGKVGIGTTSPVAALTVKSNSTSSGNSGFTLMDNSDTNPIVQIGEKSTDGGRLHMYDGGTLKVSLYTDGTDNFINAGNLGIGTDSPDSPLHVKGAGDSSSTTAFEVDDSGGQNLFYVRDDGVVSITHGYLFAQASSGAYFTGSIKARGGVTDDGGTLGLGGGGNLDHLNILSGGNVGIGTTSPLATLQVKNTTPYTLGEDDYSTDSIALYGAASSNDGAYFGGITWHNDGRRRAGISSVMESTDADFVGLAFHTQGTDGAGGYSESMRISRDGNVGIGTTSPSWKLQVSGSLYATSTFRTNGVILQQERAAASGSYATLGQIWVKNDAPNNLYFTDDAGTDIAITNNGALANAPTATVATTVTITDNESTDENNAIIFAAGADTDGGNLGLESDGNFTYNPSDATINAGKLNLSGSGVNITNDSATELNFNGTNNTNITTAGNMYIKAGSSKKMYLGANATDSLVTLDTNGFVGIGNTGPNHLLHVGDDVTASFGTTPDKAIQLSSSTNDHEIAYILYAGEGTNNIRSKYYVDDATKYVGWDSTHSTGWLGYEWKIAGSQSMKLDTSGNLTLSGAITSDGDVFIPSGNALQLADASDHTKIERSTGLQFYTNSAARLNILDSGNIGIGTTSPQADLHINNTSGTALYITSSDSNPTNSGSIRFAEIADGSNYYVEQKYNGNSNKLSFNSESTSDILTVMRTGNVGINIATPTTTLDVEGSVSYKHISLTADSDDLDVSGCTVVEATPSGTDRLGGLTGGVQGQVIHILKVDSGLGRLIIEHNEGTGNQDIFLSSGADVMLAARGGITLYCNGTSWFALDK